MNPDRDVEEVGEEHVETQRQGSAAGLLTGLLILVLLAGSAIFVTYFWPVFEIAAVHQRQVAWKDVGAEAGHE